MYYFIVNPTAGCGRGKKIWKTVHAELSRLFVPYESFILRYKGEARSIASGLSKLQKPFTLVVVGGDGTLNEVFSGLSSYEYVTLGCIPTGSGNDFVRGLGLKKSPVDALHTILNPHSIRRIKLGTIRSAAQQNAFGVSSGIGFDAAVCSAAYQSGLKDLLNWFHLGKLVYTGTALGQLITAKLCPMEIILEVETVLTFRKVFFAAAMNLSYEGGGFMFAPDADPERDTLTLCIAEGLSKPRILSVLPLAFFGRHVGKPGIHLLPFRKAVIRSGLPLCVHTDGEIFGCTDSITVEAHTERLSVIVS